MARRQGFIPTSHLKYDNFYKNIREYLVLVCDSKPPQWTHIPQDERETLDNAYEDWYAAYTPTLKPHTAAATAAAGAAYLRSKKVLSRFIQVWFRGFPDVVTADHLLNMEIPPIDDTPTPIGRPETRPVFHIEVRNTRLLAVHFQDEASESRAIPYGMNGAVVFWALRETPPVRPEELSESHLATRTPYLLRFGEEDRGKTVYVALLWQNESGEKGDFTEIESAIVP
jgi:hypothetical protein